MLAIVIDLDGRRLRDRLVISAAGLGVAIEQQEVASRNSSRNADKDVSSRLTANRTEFGRDLTVIESGFESDSLRIRQGLIEGIAEIALVIAVSVVTEEAVGKLGPIVAPIFL